MAGVSNGVSTPRMRTRQQTRSQNGLAKLDTNVVARASPSDATSPASKWLSRKTTALVLLVLQNASVSLLTRASRTPRVGQRPYAPAVAVFVAELMKLSLTMVMLVRERRGLARSKRDGKAPGYLATATHAVWDLAINQKEEIIKLSVPAALYATQNTLLYLALSNLDAATYQTTYQLKLLTAAMFSILFFRRSLSPRKWTALFILTVGVAIVQLDTVGPASDAGATNPRVGLAAILAACVSSGLAGGWFEYVLKAPASKAPPSPDTPDSASSKSPRSTAPPRLRDNSPSLWARNLQLAVPSLCFSFTGAMLSSDWSRNGGGMLQGFTPLVWSVVANQAMGGLLVALVVREADGVAKGFATSIAIVLSTLASIVFFRLVPGPLFVAGASLVILSTILYALDPS